MTCNFIFLGLGFRPLPPEDNVESTLIWYRGTNKENYEVWTNALDEFLHRKLKA
jgi:sodium/potassium-transporting ATPase subunit beta